MSGTIHIDRAQLRPSRYTQRCTQGCGNYTDKTAIGHAKLFGHKLEPIKPAKA